MARVEIDEVVFNDDGHLRAAGGIPFTITYRDGSPASIYDSPTGGSVIPLISRKTDVHGRVNGWVEEGRYTIIFTPPNLSQPPYTLYYEAFTGGGVGANASDTTKGILRLSVAPANPADPIGVGDNDPRFDGIPPAPASVVPSSLKGDPSVGNNQAIVWHTAAGGAWVPADLAEYDDPRFTDERAPLNDSVIPQKFSGHPAPATGQGIKWDMSGDVPIAVPASFVEDPGGSTPGALLIRGSSSWTELDPGGTAQQIIVRSDGTVGYGPPPEFHVSAWGAVGDGIADDRAAIQNAITACENAGGGVVKGMRGATHKLDSVAPLKFARNGVTNVTGTRPWVIFDGNGCTIKLTNNVYRAFDLNRQADYDVFARVGVRNVRVDTSALTPTTINSSNQHILFGTQLDGGGLAAQRVTIKGIDIRNCESVNTAPRGRAGQGDVTSASPTVNNYVGNLLVGDPIKGTGIPAGTTVSAIAGTVLTMSANGTATNTGVSVNATANRAWIALTCRHLGAGETQNQIEDVTIEDCTFWGGNSGFGAWGNPASGTTCEVRLDRVRLNKCFWDGGSVPAPGAFTPSAAGCQLGGNGFGGTITITNCWFRNSEDVGIELDAITYSTVRNTVCQDSWNTNFYATNYRASEAPGLQIARWLECESRLVNLNPLSDPGGASRGRGFAISAPGTPTFGHYYMRGCTHYGGHSTYGSTNGYAVEAYDVAVSKVSIIDFSVVLDSISYTNTATGYNATLIRIAPRTDSMVIIKDFSYKLQGAVTVSSGSLRHRPIYVAPRNSSTMRLYVDGVYPDVNVSGVTTSGQYLDIGAESGTVRGYVRNYRPQAWAAGQDTLPRHICIRGTSTLTLPTPFHIDLCNFDAVTTSHFSIYFTNAPQNQDKVKITNTNWSLVGNSAGTIWPASPPAAQAVSFPNGTGDISNGFSNIVNVTGTWYVGQGLSHANFPAGTTVTAVSGTTVTVSNNATGTANGATLTKVSPFVYQNDSAVPVILDIIGGTVQKIDVARTASWPGNDTGQIAGGVPLDVGAFARLTTAQVAGSGDTTTGSKQVANATGTWRVGMAISGAGIPANTFVVGVVGSTVTMSEAATATAAGVSISGPATVTPTAERRAVV